MALEIQGHERGSVRLGQGDGNGRTGDIPGNLTQNMAFSYGICYTEQMKFRHVSAGLAALLAPVAALAQGAGGCQPGFVANCPPGVQNCICVSSGFSGGLPELILRVVMFLSYAIGTFCTIAFLVGAFLIVLSRGQEPLLPRGKNLVIESLIGLAVVLGANGILRVVMYVLYIPA